MPDLRPVALLRWAVLVDGWDELVVEAADLGVQSVLADLMMKRFAGDGADTIAFAEGIGGGDGVVYAGDEVIASFVWRPADEPGWP